MFKLLVCRTGSWGGYYGVGETERQAVANCKKACKDAGDRWSNYTERQVMIDVATGQTIWRKGKQ